MQPLPPAITGQVFANAARDFTRAAGHLEGGEASQLLASAARLTFQGVPSLLMTTGRDSGSRELATRLRDAADAALVLSKQIAAQPTADFSSHHDAVLGWSELAEAAVAALEGG